MEMSREPEAVVVRSPHAGWTVCAGPITRADQLRAFITDVGRLEGVTGLVAEHFRLGEISLRLCYAGSQSLVACLAALPGAAARIETADGGVIRLTFDDASRDD